MELSFFSSGICVLQFLCVRSWERRLELACLGVGWPATLQASLLVSFPREDRPSRASGISCLHFLTETATCSLLKLLCLFLAKPLFNLCPLSLLILLLSVVVDRRAAGRLRTKYWPPNSFYVSFGGKLLTLDGTTLAYVIA